MKSGFSGTVDLILRNFGLKTDGCVGTYWGGLETNWSNLLALGYRIEKGIINPEYDYVIISKEKSTLTNLIVALTRTKVGCIIIFRADGIPTIDIDRLARTTKSTLYFWSYGDEKEGKLLGVFLKRKD